MPAKRRPAPKGYPILSSSRRETAGAEFRDLSACHDHALRIIGECLPFLQNDPRRWWIDIADEHGKRALTVLYPSRERSPRTFGRIAG
jgi:hypothetical protein